MFSIPRPDRQKYDSVCACSFGRTVVIMNTNFDSEKSKDPHETLMKKQREEILLVICVVYFSDPRPDKPAKF